MVTLLEREMYTEASAARLLRVAPGTLHYWLEGRTRVPKIYKPVIREEATGSNRVTWAEFVEASLLRQYRRIHNIPMLELRNFIESLRHQLGVPYPLAHAKPYTFDHKLVIEAQIDAKLDAEFSLIAEVSGQYILTPAAQGFFDRVTWDEDIAARWRPANDPDSPVVVDPEVRFGAPSVGGISTAILWEQASGGEDEGDLAATYSLTGAQVRWTLSYEMTNEAA